MPHPACSCCGASRNDYKEQISFGSAALYKLDLRNDSGKIRLDNPNLGRHGKTWGDCHRFLAYHRLEEAQMYIPVPNPFRRDPGRCREKTGSGNRKRDLLRWAKMHLASRE